MSNRLQHICYAIVFCFLISSCQSDKETSVLQPPAQKQTSEQIQPGKTQKVSVLHDMQEIKPATPPVVNLELSKELLDQIVANSQQVQTSDMQKKMEIDTAELRKVKISGGILIDKNEEDLTKKVDGGEVKISLPFN